MKRSWVNSVSILDPPPECGIAGGELIYVKIPPKEIKSEAAAVASFRKEFRCRCGGEE